MSASELVFGVAGTIAILYLLGYAFMLAGAGAMWIRSLWRNRK